MEHTLRVSTWNLHGALSETSDSVEAVLDVLDQVQPDVITLPDAWHENTLSSACKSPRELLVSDDSFREEGYTALKATFREDRSDDDHARYGFLTLVKDTTPLISSKEIELGTRPAHHLRLYMGHHVLNLVSLYLNDQSEANRQQQIDDLFRYLDPHLLEPIVLSGDFNAMHPRSKIATLLRSAPVRLALSKVSYKNNTLPRLVDMASGSIVTRLESARFQDTELRHRPTMPSGLPLFQLDHIFIRDGALVSLTATRPTQHAEPILSDHRLLTTKITALTK